MQFPLETTILLMFCALSDYELNVFKFNEFRRFTHPSSFQEYRFKLLKPSFEKLGFNDTGSHLEK